MASIGYRYLVMCFSWHVVGFAVENFEVNRRLIGIICGKKSQTFASLDTVIPVREPIK